MVLGKLPVPGRPTIWMIVGQGPIALAVGAGGGCLDIFTLLYPFSLSPSLWETVRYRLKYCLKGPLNPKQPTNQPNLALLCLSYLLLSLSFFEVAIPPEAVSEKLIYPAANKTLSDVENLKPPNQKKEKAFQRQRRLESPGSLVD